MQKIRNHAYKVTDDDLHRLRARFSEDQLFEIVVARAPDVVRTLRYRATFFGRAHRHHTHAVMRGTSAWTIGERELFAAFVSRLNQCEF